MLFCAFLSALGARHFRDDHLPTSESVVRVGEIAGWDPIFHKVDLCDGAALREIFKKVRPKLP